MATKTVPKARPGQRVKIGRRLYEYAAHDGTLSYYADIELDGVQRRRKLDANGRNEARVAQGKLEGENSEGNLVAPSKLTVAEVAAEWLDTLDVKPRSREAYEERVRLNIVPRLGARAVQSIRPKDCTAFMRWLRDERKLSPASRTSVVNLLNSILKHAVTEEYIASNPLERVDRKQKPPKKVPHRYLTPNEVTALLENANGYRVFYELLAYSGLRYSEAAGLVWSDIDLAEGTISVTAQLARGEAKRVPTKTEEERIVNIDPELVATLREHKTKALSLGRAGGEQFVFQTADGKALDYRNMWGGFQTAVKRAGLNDQGRKLRIHDLRRTYASILLNDGQPAPFVAKQLGHTVDVLFRTYAGLIENQQGQHRERQLGAVAAFRSGAS